MARDLVPSLKDLETETFEIRCDLCPYSATFTTADLKKEHSEDVALSRLTEYLTQNCGHRKPYKGTPPCAAYSPQEPITLSAMRRRKEEWEEERQKIRAEQEEADRLQEERERNAVVRLAAHNGWMMYEAMPVDTKPKYRWQQSWEDEQPEDIIGFDGNTPIGRVFRFEPHMTNRDVWFWVLYGVEERKRARPGQGAGWEKSRLLAACRVEWCYERMLQHEKDVRRWSEQAK